MCEIFPLHVLKIFFQSSVFFLNTIFFDVITRWMIKLIIAIWCKIFLLRRNYLPWIFWRIKKGYHLIYKITKWPINSIFFIKHHSRSTINKWFEHKMEKVFSKWKWKHSATFSLNENVWRENIETTREKYYLLQKKSVFRWIANWMVGKIES